MEFRILGPLEVVDGSCSRPLGGRRQRGLLADLLLHANHVVPADRLIDDLWGDEPPSSGRHALRVDVSRLRKVVEGGSARLEAAPFGYVLRLEPEDLDLTRFEQLVADGRRALAQGWPSEAAEKLGSALALWRGEVLSDLPPENFLGPHVARLNDLRLSAVEDRIEAELALGRHGEVVAEFGSLAAANPFRERLQAQLMLALYRSGRQGEALSLYHEARHALAEDLGIDPGPTLRDLAQAILRQDPTLAWDPTSIEPAPDRDSSPAEETRKIVTVLFADVQVVTPDAVSADPERFRGTTRACFAEIRGVLERFGGSPVGWAGNSLMAIFGVPAIHEDDPFRALNAAAEIRDVPDRLREKLRLPDQAMLALRVGVSTGVVLVGPSRHVTGEPVTSAARLQRSAKAGEVLLDAPTERLVRDAARTEQTKIVTGAIGPTVYRLIQVTPGIRHPISRLHSPMVGRRSEAAMLKSAFRRCVKEQSCVSLTVLGGAGVGKSRLVGEFARSVEDRARILTGACLSYGDGLALWPVGVMLRQAVGFGGAEEPEHVRGKIDALLKGQDDAEAVSERIVALLGLAELELSEGEMFWAIRRLFEVLAKDRPLVAIFEDLHWAQPGLLDLIENLKERCREAAIEIVGTARPEFLGSRANWREGPNATSLELPVLTERETTLLVRNLLDSTELPASMTSEILEAAGGNPLFVEQILWMLIDDGVLRQEGGAWVVADERAAMSIPPGIHALLAARLDRLPPSERELLQRASVIGHVFYPDAVRVMTPSGDDHLVRGSLETLTRKHLVAAQRSDLPGQEAFAFVHALIGDVAYSSLPKEARAEMHERFADWFERVAGERIAEREEILGYHLEQAFRLRSELGPTDARTETLARDAARHLGAAGERALDRGDAVAASNLLGRAVELLPAEDPERRRLLPDLIEAVGDSGNDERFLALSEEAIEIGRATADRVLEQWGLLERSAYFVLLHPREATLEELTKVITGSVRAFEELGDEAGLVRALLVLVADLWCEGSPLALLDAAERALELSFRCRPASIADAVFNIGAAMQMGPTPASEALARTRELAERFADRPLVEAVALMWSGDFLAMLGRHEEAASLPARCQRTFSDLGAPWWIVQGEERACFQMRLAGDLPTAERLTKTMMKHWRDMGVATNAADGAAALAALRYELGRLDDCYRAAEEAEELAGPWDIEARLQSWGTRAKVLARRGEVREAEDLILEAERAIRATELFTDTADVLMAKAEILCRAGRTDEATAAAREALDMYERKEFVPMANKARTFLEELAR